MKLHILDGSQPAPAVEVEGIRPGATPAAVTAVCRGRGMTGYAIKHWHYGMAWVPDVPALLEADERGEDDERPEASHDVGGEG